MLKTLGNYLKRIKTDFKKLVEGRKKTNQQWKMVTTEIESDDYLVGVDFSDDPQLGNESNLTVHRLNKEHFLITRQQIREKKKQNRRLFWRKKKSQRKRGWE
jgi:hypothetical protein